MHGGNDLSMLSGIDNQHLNKSAMHNHGAHGMMANTTADNSAYMMMNTTAENHTRNLPELPRDKTLIMEETKGYQSRHGNNNSNNGDFLSGLGIMNQHSKTMISSGRPQSV